MIRRVHLAPLALTSDGDLLLNVTAIASATDLASVVRAAESEHRAVFVGVMLSPRETEFAMARLDNAADDSAARIVERRLQRREKKRSRK